jgi:hypothetical protein
MELVSPHTHPSGLNVSLRRVSVYDTVRRASIVTSPNSRRASVISQLRTNSANTPKAPEQKVDEFKKKGLLYQFADKTLETEFMKFYYGQKLYAEL